MKSLLKKKKTNPSAESERDRKFSNVARAASSHESLGTGNSSHTTLKANANPAERSQEAAKKLWEEAPTADELKTYSTQTWNVFGEAGKRVRAVRDRCLEQPRDPKLTPLKLPDLSALFASKSKTPAPLPEAAPKKPSETAFPPQLASETSLKKPSDITLPESIANKSAVSESIASKSAASESIASKSAVPEAAIPVMMAGMPLVPPMANDLPPCLTIDRPVMCCPIDLIPQLSGAQQGYPPPFPPSSGPTMPFPPMTGPPAFLPPMDATAAAYFGALPFPPPGDMAIPVLPVAVPMPFPPPDDTTKSVKNSKRRKPGRKKRRDKLERTCCCCMEPTFDDINSWSHPSLRKRKWWLHPIWKAEERRGKLPELEDPYRNFRRGQPPHSEVLWDVPPPVPPPGHPSFASTFRSRRWTSRPPGPLKTKDQSFRHSTSGIPADPGSSNTAPRPVTFIEDQPCPELEFETTSQPLQNSLGSDQWKSVSKVETLNENRTPSKSRIQPKTIPLQSSVDPDPLRSACREHQNVEINSTVAQTSGECKHLSPCYDSHEADHHKTFCSGALKEIEPLGTCKTLSSEYSQKQMVCASTGGGQVAARVDCTVVRSVFLTVSRKSKRSKEKSVQLSVNLGGPINRSNIITCQDSTCGKYSLVTNECSSSTQSDQSPCKSPCGSQSNFEALQETQKVECVPKKYCLPESTCQKNCESQSTDEMQSTPVHTSNEVFPCQTDGTVRAQWRNARMKCAQKRRSKGNSTRLPMTLSPRRCAPDSSSTSTPCQDEPCRNTLRSKPYHEAPCSTNSQSQDNSRKVHVKAPKWSNHSWRAETQPCPPYQLPGVVPQSSAPRWAQHPPSISQALGASSTSDCSMRENELARTDQDLTASSCANSSSVNTQTDNSSIQTSLCSHCYSRGSTISDCSTCKICSSLSGNLSCTGRCGAGQMSFQGRSAKATAATHCPCKCQHFHSDVSTTAEADDVENVFGSSSHQSTQEYNENSVMKHKQTRSRTYSPMESLYYGDKSHNSCTRNSVQNLLATASNTHLFTALNVAANSVHDLLEQRNITSQESYDETSDEENPENPVSSANGMLTNTIATPIEISTGTNLPSTASSSKTYVVSTHANVPCTSGSKSNGTHYQQRPVAGKSSTLLLTMEDQSIIFPAELRRDPQTSFAAQPVSAFSTKADPPPLSNLCGQISSLAPNKMPTWDPGHSAKSPINNLSQLNNSFPVLSAVYAQHSVYKVDDSDNPNPSEKEINGYYSDTQPEHDSSLKSSKTLLILDKDKNKSPLYHSGGVHKETVCEDRYCKKGIPGKTLFEASSANDQEAGSSLYYQDGILLYRPQADPSASCQNNQEQTRPACPVGCQMSSRKRVCGTRASAVRCRRTTRPCFRCANRPPPSSQNEEHVSLFGSIKRFFWGPPPAKACPTQKCNKKNCPLHQPIAQLEPNQSGSGIEPTINTAPNLHPCLTCRHKGKDQPRRKQPFCTQHVLRTDEEDATKTYSSQPFSTRNHSQCSVKAAPNFTKLFPSAKLTSRKSHSHKNPYTDDNDEDGPSSGRCLKTRKHAFNSARSQRRNKKSHYQQGPVKSLMSYTDPRQSHSAVSNASKLSTAHCLNQPSVAVELNDLRNLSLDFDSSEAESEGGSYTKTEIRQELFEPSPPPLDLLTMEVSQAFPLKTPSMCSHIIERNLGSGSISMASINCQSCTNFSNEICSGFQKPCPGQSSSESGCDECSKVKFYSSKRYCSLADWKADQRADLQYSACPLKFDKEKSIQRHDKKDRIHASKPIQNFAFPSKPGHASQSDQRQSTYLAPGKVLQLVPGDLLQPNSRDSLQPHSGEDLQPNAKYAMEPVPRTKLQPPQDKTNDKWRCVPNVSPSTARGAENLLSKPYGDYRPCPRNKKSEKRKIPSRQSLPHPCKPFLDTSADSDLQQDLSERNGPSPATKGIYYGGKFNPVNCLESNITSSIHRKKPCPGQSSSGSGCEECNMKRKYTTKVFTSHSHWRKGSSENVSVGPTMNASKAYTTRESESDARADPNHSSEEYVNRAEYPTPSRSDMPTRKSRISHDQYTRSKDGVTRKKSFSKGNTHQKLFQYKPSDKDKPYSSTRESVLEYEEDCEIPLEQSCPKNEEKEECAKKSHETCKSERVSACIEGACRGTTNANRTNSSHYGLEQETGPCDIKTYQRRAPQTYIPIPDPPVYRERQGIYRERQGESRPPCSEHERQCPPKEHAPCRKSDGCGKCPSTDYFTSNGVQTEPEAISCPDACSEAKKSDRKPCVCLQPDSRCADFGEIYQSSPCCKCTLHYCKNCEVLKAKRIKEKSTTVRHRNKKVQFSGTRSTHQKSKRCSKHKKVICPQQQCSTNSLSCERCQVERNVTGCQTCEDKRCQPERSCTRGQPQRCKHSCKTTQPGRKNTKCENIVSEPSGCCESFMEMLAAMQQCHKVSQMCSPRDKVVSVPSFSKCLQTLAKVYATLNPTNKTVSRENSISNVECYLPSKRNESRCDPCPPQSSQPQCDSILSTNPCCTAPSKPITQDRSSAGLQGMFSNLKTASVCTDSNPAFDYLKRSVHNQRDKLLEVEKELDHQLIESLCYGMREKCLTKADNEMSSCGTKQCSPYMRPGSPPFSPSMVKPPEQTGTYSCSTSRKLSFFPTPRSLCRRSNPFTYFGGYSGHIKSTLQCVRSKSSLKSRSKHYLLPHSRLKSTSSYSSSRAKQFSSCNLSPENSNKEAPRDFSRHRTFRSLSRLKFRGPRTQCRYARTVKSTKETPVALPPNGLPHQLSPASFDRALPSTETQQKQYRFANNMPNLSYSRRDFEFNKSSGLPLHNSLGAHCGILKLKDSTCQPSVNEKATESETSSHSPDNTGYLDEEQDLEPTQYQNMKTVTFAKEES